MNRSRFHIQPAILGRTIAALAFLSSSSLLSQAAPYTEATVTRVQNKVSYGEQQGGQSVTRPAAAQDVVRAKNYLLSEADSRAELKYPDGTIVRIGQNTVFSFDADTRTLNLTKGAFIFYVPKGQGGATIKTPSLTAAITGTVGKVSGDTIAIIEGSVKLIPGGEIVLAGQFARRNPDGTITIDWFKKGTEFDGVLMTFNGPLPPFVGGTGTGTGPTFDPTEINLQEVLERTANHPGAMNQFFPPQPQRQENDRPNPTPIPIPTATPRPPVTTPKPRPTSPPPEGSGGEVIIGDFVKPNPAGAQRP